MEQPGVPVGGNGGRGKETGAHERSMTYLGFFKLTEGLPLLLASQALLVLVQREIRARLRVVRVCRALKRKTNPLKLRPEAANVITSESLSLLFSPRRIHKRNIKTLVDIGRSEYSPSDDISIIINP